MPRTSGRGFYFRSDRLGFEANETLEIRNALAKTYRRLGHLDQAPTTQEEDLPRYTIFYDTNHELTIITQV